MLVSHAQKTRAWDAFAFAETLLTQPVMVMIGQKVGSFGAFRDGMEIYGRATASKDRQLISLGQGMVGAIKRVAAKAMS
jgi:uncharacterized protein